MRSWPAAGALLLALAAIPARAASPVAQWSKGDWWDVQLEQPMLHSATAATAWTPSYRLHFTVTQVESKGIAVEVTTEPENSLKQRLSLLYSAEGKLIAAEVVEPDLIEPLGSAGGFGVFGPLGREAFDLFQAPGEPPGGLLEPRSAAPFRKGGPIGRGRLFMHPNGRTLQFWAPGDAFWKRFETSGAMPHRAVLLNGYWQQRARPNPNPSPER